MLPVIHKKFANFNLFFLAAGRDLHLLSVYHFLSWKLKIDILSFHSPFSALDVDYSHTIAVSISVNTRGQKRNNEWLKSKLCDT